MLFFIIAAVLLIGFIICFVRPSPAYDAKLATNLLEKCTFPMAERILCLFDRFPKIMKNTKKKMYLRQVYIYERDGNRGQQRELRMIMLMLVLLLAGSIFGGVLSYVSLQRSELKKGRFVERKEPEKGDKEVSLEVRLPKKKKELTLSVPERTYTKKELQTLFVRGKKYVKTHYLGENKSSDAVCKPLCLMRKVPNTGLSVNWKLPDENIIEESGKLQTSKITEPVQLELRAVLFYEKKNETIVFSITVLPRKMTKEQRQWSELQKSIKKVLYSNSSKKVVALPLQSDELAVSYREKRANPGVKFFLFTLAVIVSIPFVVMEQLKTKAEERNQELLFDYPELIDRIILLLGAGLTMKGAWYRLTEEYEKKCRKGAKKRYLFEEMLVTRYSMENGLSELAAYEQFGKNIGIFSYMKFSSLVTQNLKKGSEGILQLLEQESIEALQMRRNQAKVLGEKAGTKLLVPMIIMLAEVFAIIIIPAFWSM